MKEDRDLKYIVVLFVWIVIAVGLWILYNSWKIMQPKEKSCWIIVSRETREDWFVNDKTYGTVMMAGGYKSFSLIAYAVIGDTICMEWNWWKKKDTFIR